MSFDRGEWEARTAERNATPWPEDKPPRANRTCTIKNCHKPAPWRLDCTDHPNGGAVYWYCHAHLPLPAWEDAPAPYTMTVSGPHR